MIRQKKLVDLSAITDFVDKLRYPIRVALLYGSKQGSRSAVER